MRDYLKGKRCMVWSFMGNARMYEALRDYGDRFDTVGIFTFSMSATTVFIILIKVSFEIVISPKLLVISIMQLSPFLC